ncbi:secretin N-terminal domain-containing protein [Candidatus Omnitrophota bacterium]
MTKKIIIYLTIFFISIFLLIPLLQAEYYEDETEFISLDIKGMDIKDVLKILSQKSGLNIVSNKDVSGTVSIYVRDIDVMDALDIVVSTNGLAYEREGTLVRVMTDRNYELLNGKTFMDRTETEIVSIDHANASDVASAIMKMKTKSGKIIPDDRSNTIIIIDNPDSIKNMEEVISRIDVSLIAEVFSLDYAKAEPLRDKLEHMLSADIGTIKFDERTNKVIVKDTPQKIEEIKMLIKAFDEKTREVVIDATIVEVRLSDKYNHGINWGDLVKLCDAALAGDASFMVNPVDAAPGALMIATTTNYKTVAGFLKVFGEINVLSRPRITVADKEEAKILVGSKEVYVTSEVTTTSGGTYHTTDNVEFIDVGVKLAVTPEINNAGFVRLKIKPEISTADDTKTVKLKNSDGSTRAVVPFVNTSEAETTVLIKDNATLVISGLIKDSIKKKSKEKTELVIFLTPRIVGREIKYEEKEVCVKAENIEIPVPKVPEIQLESEKDIALEAKQPQMQKKDEKDIALEVKELKEKKKIKSQAKKTPYDEYYFVISEEINSIVLRQDVSGLEGAVELQFSLDKEGFITRGPTVLNKPDLLLVRNAVNCIKEGAPYPPFSRKMKKDEEEFSVVLRYK